MSPYPASKPVRALPALASPRRGSGATLVELLVTIGLSAFLLIVLMQVFALASGSWLTQNKVVSAQREIRTGLRILADDLASLTALPFTADTPEASRFFLQYPPDDYGSARMAFLRLNPLRNPADSTEQSDTCLVLYTTIYSADGSPVTGAESTYSQKLVRRILSPAETFQRLDAHLAAKAPLINDSDWSGMAVPSPENAVIARNVLRFTVEAANADNPPSPVIPWPQAQVPAWVDLTLRIVNEQTASQLQSQADWSGRGTLAQLLLNGTPLAYGDDREVRTLSMRLALPGNPYPLAE